MRSTSFSWAIPISIKTVLPLLTLFFLTTPPFIHNSRNTNPALTHAIINKHGSHINNIININNISSLSDPFFDTKILNNPRKMQKVLKSEGFIEGFFNTQDNIRINYLYKTQPNARYNFLFCCGWWPGRKEALGTFYRLIPSDANMMLFDARGHGRSEGSMFTTTYGLSEYKDIIGAIKFLHETSGKPTIILGICAGAFHAAHAIANLEATGMAEQYQIKGLIFDSGWTSVASVSRTTPSAHLTRMLHKWLGSEHASENTNTKGVFTHVTERSIDILCGIAHTLLLRPFFVRYEHETNLSKKINNIQTPILFIHGTNDTHAPISETQKLAERAPNSECWWISQPSHHGCHHLKHTERYRIKLHAFIEKITTKNEQNLLN